MSTRSFREDVSLGDGRPLNGIDDPLSILLVGDAPGDIRRFEEHLRESRTPVELQHAESPQESLDVLWTVRPDVLVVDLDLQDSQGPETVRAVAGAVPDVPIVALTGLSEPAAALEAQEAGAVECLRKDELTPALAGRTVQWAAQHTRMRQKLRQRDAWIRSITESMAGGMFRVGPTGRIEYASEALVELLGYEQEEDLIGRDLTRLYAHPEDRGRVLAAEGAERAEIAFERCDGTVFTGLLSAEPTYGEEMVRHYDGVIVDVTQRKLREQELRRSREQLATAQRIAGLGSWERSFEEDRLDWSAETRRIFGWAPDEEITYEKLMASVHPDDRAKLKRQQEAALREGTPIDVEYRIRRPDGEERVLQEQGEIEFGPDGSPRRLSGTVLDITERKEKERRLQILSEAVKQADDGILVTEVPAGEEIGTEEAQASTIVYANSAFEEMTGYAEAELLGRTTAILQGPETDAAVIESLREAIANEQSWEGEAINYRKDGTPYVAQWTAAPVYGNGGPPDYWVSVQRDVTEKRETERQLRKQEERFRGLANSIPGVVYQFVVRPDGSAGYEFVGERAEALLGISSAPDDFHERFLARIPASHREKVRAASEEAIREEIPLRIDVPFDRPDGERIWLLCTSTPERRDTDEGVALVYNGVMLDITGQKNAEAALQEERDRFEALFDSLPSPAIRCALREEGTVIEDANAAFTDAFGGGGDVEGLDANELLFSSDEVPEHLRAEAARIEHRAVEEGSVQAEVQRTTADGPRDFQLQVSGRTPNDGPPEVYAIYTDITERKQVEATLREREAQVRGLANTIPGILFRFHAEEDGTYGFTFIGEQAGDVLGLSPSSEDLFDQFAERIPLGHRDAFLQSVESAIQEGREWRHEMPFERPDGEQIWLLGIAAPEQRGDQFVFNGVVTDITEQKETRQRLRESEQRYRTLAENFPNGAVGVYDADLRYMLAAGDQAGEALPSADQVEGRRMPEVFPEDTAQEIEPVFRAAIEEGTTDSIETRFNGRIWTVWATPLRDADGDISAGLSLAQDITARKRRERELREAKEAAEEAAQLKAAMMANMSHEIRTPLTSIIGFAEVLADEVEGNLEVFAEKAYRSSQRLLKTLDSVLEVSRLEAGAVQLDRELVRLPPLVQNIVEGFRPRVNEKGLTLETELPSQQVSGALNEEALRRILANLLENAIKFTPAEGRVTVRVGEAEGNVHLEVEDTGVGISEEALPEIFQAFKQESDGLNRAYEGTGLGLSIVQELTDALGGTVEVESEKGQGSRFTVRLPTAEGGAV